MNALNPEIDLRHACEPPLRKIAEILDVDTDYERKLTEIKLLYRGEEYLVTFRRVTNLERKVQDD